MRETEASSNPKGLLFMEQHPRFFRAGTLGGACWGLLAVFSASPLIAADGPANKVEPTFEVRKILDVPYYEGPDADPIKHKLDLYLPKDQKDFPVIFFVHGGAWRHGDKSSFLGFYGTLASSWARHGLGVVVTNYRLSPSVSHPEHIKDVARAFAWTHTNIAKYGGRADEIFVSGHSAGGHLVALLATDESYLKAQGLTLKAIRGAIPLSGVYRIAASSHMYDAIFGEDRQVRRQASPVCHACPEAPPFLIIYADQDFVMCNKKYAEEFCAALQEHKARAKSLEIPDRNHVTLLLKAASDADPVNKAVRDFIAEHTREKMADGEKPITNGLSAK
jgi:acetyl esterase/lipase